MSEERSRRAAAVGADQGRIAVPELVRDLREGLVEQRDVVCGGVRAGD
jgi:hypothetical protein